MAAVDRVEDRQAMVLRNGPEFLPREEAEKFSTAEAHFEAQKALTGQNLGGYDALTVPN